MKLKKKYGRTYEVCLICWRKQSDDRNNTRRKTDRRALIAAVRATAGMVG